MTAWLLFAAKRARPDIQVALVNLCTKGRKPTGDDYLKSTRVISMMRNSRKTV